MSKLKNPGLTKMWSPVVARAKAERTASSRLPHAVAGNAQVAAATRERGWVRRSGSLVDPGGDPATKLPVAALGLAAAVQNTGVEKVASAASTA